MHNYKPPFALKNKHLQTLYSSFFRKKEILNFEIQRFILSDKDFLEAYWINKPKQNDKKPIVIIFHGLQGSFNSPYINGIMNALKKASFSCVLMHFRSCSGKMNEKLGSYHSGQTDDAREFIRSVKELHPNNDLFAIGYSLGGNVLLKLLGEDGAKSLLKAAVSVCAPLDLDITADAISKGFSHFYEYNILRTLKKDLLFKYEKHDVEKITFLKKKDVHKVKTIREFDEKYTSKIFGFGNSQNYYKLSSSKQYLRKIRIKTLLIHSLDDPFMHKDVLPSKNELAPCIKLEVYAHGGHIGFITGSIIKPIYFLDLKITDYFKSCL